VDGQQRTTAIFKYISNKFKLKESYLNSDHQHFDNIKNRFFKDLETEEKKALWAYIFSIRAIRNSIQREDIVNMFLSSRIIRKIRN